MFALHAAEVVTLECQHHLIALEPCRCFQTLSEPRWLCENVGGGRMSGRGMSLMQPFWMAVFSAVTYILNFYASVVFSV